jgi:hypothetical protein
MKIALALFACALPAAAQGSAYVYCHANPNSFGTTARIGYTGSLNLADDTFTLTVTGCPPAPEGFGMFTCGTTQYDVPFGHGYLCIQPFYPGGVHRMGLQPLLTGTVTRNIHQAPADFAMFQPGSSWNFQFWYRNPAAGGPGFNLSDGLHVDFAPSN